MCLAMHFKCVLHMTKLWGRIYVCGPLCIYLHNSHLSLPPTPSSGMPSWPLGQGQTSGPSRVIHIFSAGSSGTQGSEKRRELWGTKQPLPCGHSPRHHCRRPNPHAEKVLVRRKAIGQSRQIACREKWRQELLLLCRRQKLANSLVQCGSTWFPFLETWGSSCWIFSKTTFYLY